MTVSQAHLMRLFARWHRRIALLVALWLIVLATSGILINHAHDWKLDSTALPALLQESVYGIEVNTEVNCGPATAAAIDCSSVFTRMELPAGYLLLSADNLYLLDESGQLIEQLATHHMGLGKLSAALHDGAGIYLRDERNIVRTDNTLADWETLGPDANPDFEDSRWQHRTETAQAVTWERLLLDLHAARFLGGAGIIFSDLMALLILVLAVSGIWLYRIKLKNNRNGINGYQ